MATATATSNSHPRPFADHIYQPVASPEHTSEAPPTMNQGHMTKVQALTPLSVLVTLAALTVCAVAISPGLGQVSQEHGTYLTPNASLVLFFWAIMFLLQVGFALLVVLSQKEFTKRTIVNGVGLRLAFSNLLLAAWAVTWVLNKHVSHLIGLVLLSLCGLLLLITVLLLQIRYPPSLSRPLDWLFIHVPIKMFLVTIIQLDIPQQTFVALGWDVSEGGKAAFENLHKALWPSFAVLCSMGALSAIWIFATMDVTWAAAGIYLHLALLYGDSKRGIGGLGERRPPEITAAIVLAIGLQAVAILGSIVQKSISQTQQQEQEDRLLEEGEPASEEGRIALGRDPQEEEAAARYEQEHDADASHDENGHGDHRVTRKLGSSSGH
ncbi:hypothetical protein FA10DRAFT_268269 [Acaromyces ingoldii]|uniref:Uncharacterized protein n=1 Tax=Acaromyces ingoldii TaxID=215250 RepID=A0A316YFR1_9BASI|nr:hypothetical protein FA10DRAFT_268269 [Acaromyces ingoldii]PWN88049.1 hypothetical protein FA10DRAFT_268269 [Acaromyces ingoldii]